jgi:hypothetical protein
MLINLFTDVRTPANVRAAIQASIEPVSALLEQFRTTKQRVCKSKNRDSVPHCGQTIHRLQATVSRSCKELSSFADAAVVRRRHDGDAPRGLDRWLRSNVESSPRNLLAEDSEPKYDAHTAFAPGHLLFDVEYCPQMSDDFPLCYLLIVVDQATPWVFIQIFESRTATNARRFLRNLEWACRILIKTVVTDSGNERVVRVFVPHRRVVKCKSEFHQRDADLGIEHRLVPPQHAQTNNVDERFNGRIEEVLRLHRLYSGSGLRTTLHNYVLLASQQLPDSALGTKTPLRVTKVCHKLEPELPRKQPYHLWECQK